MQYVSLWFSLNAALMLLLTIARGQWDHGSLIFSIFATSLIVFMTMFVRYVCSEFCSVGLAIAVSCIVLCASFTLLTLWSARSGSFNSRIGGVATWINGEPTGAGIGNLLTVNVMVLIWVVLGYALHIAAGLVVSKTLEHRE